MKFELFINFDGNCHEAVDFYAKVFKSEVKNLMTFGQFNELKTSGEVYMELQQTFFSELFGMAKDKFGVIWQILFYNT